ncbi:hypothetical protein [Oleidesulfovibrio sp.]|uniref:hypothetical protein n=1 Tax=Oleidesulfovibrio sp. TaxID=2909707 RepID=UPI003A88FBE2
MDPAPTPSASVTSGTVWHALQWNGLNMQIPELWTPTAIENTFLSFSDDSAPVFDIKWARDKRPFQLDKEKRAMRKRFTDAEDFCVDATCIPACLSEALKKIRNLFSHVAFAHAAGCGALLHNDAEGYTVLVQFHTIAGALPEQALITQLLCSLSLSPAGSPVATRIYDLACIVPTGYELRSFLFHPGHFWLEFRRGSATLAIDRFAPANVLLNGLPLRHWATKHYALPLEELSSEVQCKPPAAGDIVRWTTDRRKPLLGRVPFLRSFSGVSQHEAGAAWLVEHENKLLSVRMRDSGSVFHDDLTALCGTVEII